MSRKIFSFLVAGLAIFISQTDIASAQSFQDGLTLENLVNHLKVFQQIADQNTDLPGTRFTTTKGYDDTRDYIMQKLQDAGYQVKLQYVPVDVSYVKAQHSFEQTAPSVIQYKNNIDYVPLMNSGGAEITASMQAPRGGFGCAVSDFTGFKPGNIALLTLGKCDRSDAINNAITAGAKAVIVNFPKSGVFYFGYQPTDFNSAIHIPVLVISDELAKNLNRELAAGTAPILHIQFDAVRNTQASQNIIAESREGDPDHVVMMGAHIDSTTGNAGMNDNASAAATVLETALLMKDMKPAKKLRFVFWTGEELGLQGSNYYIEHLSAAEAAKIMVYFNYEDLGAPNGARMIMGTANGITPKGSDAFIDLYKKYFESQNEKYYVFPPTLSNAYKRSDMYAFAKAGIPVSFMASGANIPWTPAFTLIFTDLPDRINGLATHPCYHKYCDTLTLAGGKNSDPNFDFELYLQMSKAAAYAVYTTAMTV